MVVNDPKWDPNVIDLKFPAGWVVTDVTNGSQSFFVMPDGSHKPLGKGVALPNVAVGKVQVPGEPVN